MRCAHAVRKVGHFCPFSWSSSAVAVVWLNLVIYFHGATAGHHTFHLISLDPLSHSTWISVLGIR